MKFLDQLAELPLLVRGAVAVAGGAGIYGILRKAVPDRADQVALILLGAALLLLLIALTKRWLAARKSKRLETIVFPRDRAVGTPNLELQQKVQAIEQVGKDARARLKEKNYRYDLPWYMIIGPSGAGKSTLIPRCLKMQLSDLDSPVKSTSTWEWMFGAEAVIVDTAGHYVDQKKSINPLEQGAWETLLKDLRGARPARPLNGILLTIPATDLFSNDAEVGTRLARALLDIENRLGVRLPVYAIVTKCDRFPGFLEFFARFPSTHSLFGWSSPVAPTDEDALENRPTTIPSDTLRPAFTSIRQQLEAMRLEELAQNAVGPMAQRFDQRSLDQLYAFPTLFGKKLDVVHDIIIKAFSRVQQTDASGKVHTLDATRHFLRGIYFTSAVQQEKPDTLTLQQLLGQRFAEKPDSLLGVAEIKRKLAKLAPAERTSFFVGDLFEKKVLPEQGLVRRSPAEERKRKYRQYAAAAVLGLVAVVGISAVIVHGESLRGQATLVIKALESSKTPASAIAALNLLQAPSEGIPSGTRDIAKQAAWVIAMRTSAEPLIKSCVESCRAESLDTLGIQDLDARIAWFVALLSLTQHSAVKDTTYEKLFDDAAKFVCAQEGTAKYPDIELKRLASRQLEPKATDNLLKFITVEYLTTSAVPALERLARKFLEAVNFLPSASLPPLANLTSEWYRERLALLDQQLETDVRMLTTLVQGRRFPDWGKTYGPLMSRLEALRSLLDIPVPSRTRAANSPTPRDIANRLKSLGDAQAWTPFITSLLPGLDERLDELDRARQRGPSFAVVSESPAAGTRPSEPSPTWFIKGVFANKDAAGVKALNQCNRIVCFDPAKDETLAADLILHFKDKSTIDPWLEAMFSMDPEAHRSSERALAELMTAVRSPEAKAELSERLKFALHQHLHTGGKLESTLTQQLVTQLPADKFSLVLSQAYKKIVDNLGTALQPSHKEACADAKVRAEAQIATMTRGFTDPIEPRSGPRPEPGNPAYLQDCFDVLRQTQQTFVERLELAGKQTSPDLAYREPARIWQYYSTAEARDKLRDYYQSLLLSVELLQAAGSDDEKILCALRQPLQPPDHRQTVSEALRSVLAFTTVDSDGLRAYLCGKAAGVRDHLLEIAKRYFRIAWGDVGSTVGPGAKYSLTGLFPFTTAPVNNVNQLATGDQYDRLKGILRFKVLMSSVAPEIIEERGLFRDWNNDPFRRTAMLFRFLEAASEKKAIVVFEKQKIEEGGIFCLWTGDGAAAEQYKLRFVSAQNAEQRTKVASQITNSRCHVEKRLRDDAPSKESMVSEPAIQGVTPQGGTLWSFIALYYLQGFHDPITNSRQIEVPFDPAKKATVRFQVRTEPPLPALLPDFVLSTFSATQ